MKLQAAITAVHGYVPDYVLSNEVLETMVDTNSEWIETKTGIKERRTPHTHEGFLRAEIIRKLHLHYSTPHS